MAAPGTNAPSSLKDRWDSHWDRYSTATRSNPGQILRRRLIVRLLGAGGEEPDAILDFGCGSGDLIRALASSFPGAAFAGADISESGLDRTRQELPGAALVRYDFAQQSEPPGELREWATHVVCSEVLEHVDDPVRVLANAARCLKPGGRLVVTVPGGPMSAFDRHIGHQEHFTRDWIRDVLERAGFRVEVVAAAGFPVFNLYRLTVLLRGKRLIDDVSGDPGPLARSVMALFRWFMGMTLFDSPWGWQIVARAQKPAQKPD